jgi:hypothetical protein
MIEAITVTGKLSHEAFGKAVKKTSPSTPTVVFFSALKSVAETPINIKISKVKKLKGKVSNPQLEAKNRNREDNLRRSGGGLIFKRT